MAFPSSSAACLHIVQVICVIVVIFSSRLLTYNTYYSHTINMSNKIAGHVMSFCFRCFRLTIVLLYHCPYDVFIVRLSRKRLLTYLLTYLLSIHKLCILTRIQPSMSSSSHNDDDCTV